MTTQVFILDAVVVKRTIQTEEQDGGSRVPINTRMNELILKLKKIWWWIQDDCESCGGELEYIHLPFVFRSKARCTQCHKEQ